jgi:hypothetical protein
MPKRHRNKIIISSLVILGVILVIVGTTSAKKSHTEYEDYISSTEEKLENFLKSVDGINEAKVIITVDDLGTKDDDSLFSENDKDVSLPNVRGVAIACTNGDNYEIQHKLTMLVSSYLGIPTNRVKIVAIK